MDFLQKRGKKRGLENAGRRALSNFHLGRGPVFTKLVQRKKGDLLDQKEWRRNNPKRNTNEEDSTEKSLTRVINQELPRQFLAVSR